MIAIQISFLSGRLVATDMARDRAEWPAHPERIFMALVAAWAETSLRSEARVREVLELLEAAEPPSFSLPEASLLETRSHFVPVNGRNWETPTNRLKRPRDFHSVIPADGKPLYAVWPNLHLSEEQRGALARLCGRVSYIGHSSSVVSVIPVEQYPPLNLVPHEHGGENSLRVPFKGRLAELESLYKSGRRPTPSRWARYAPPSFSSSKAFPKSNLAGEILVLKRKGGGQLTLPATLALTRSLRGSFLKHLKRPSGFLSGHEDDGSPLRAAHVSFVPLPHVGHRHADGRLLGVAVLVPPGTPADEWDLCLETVAQVVQKPLLFGTSGVWEIESSNGVPSQQSLDARRWRGPSRTWATVTPVALDRYPKKEGDIVRALQEACIRVGLPPPRVALSVPVSPLEGVPHARDFPGYQNKPEAAKRWHTHAVLEFTEEVEGPIVLGAGRFFGYGLCLPIKEF